MSRSSKSAEKRRNIREAAYRCFRAHGYHETTVDAICAGAEVSKGSLYWHYSSKHEIFVDLIETWAREVMDELYEQFEDTPKQDDFLVALSDALRREAHRGRAIVPVWLEFSVVARHDPELQAVLATFYRRARLGIGELLRPFTPRYSDLERTGISAAVFAAYTGIMMQALADPNDADPDQLLEGFIAVMERWWDPTTSDGRPGEAEVPSDILSWLRPAAPESRSRILALRQEIRARAPGASERIIRGWNQLAFDLGGLFCALKPARGQVIISFHHGVELPDPAGLLSGRGKRTRHCHVATAGPTPPEVLTLLSHAIKRQKD
jgi:AcrR family transcriptional regulator